MIPWARLAGLVGLVAAVGIAFYVVTSQRQATIERIRLEAETQMETARANAEREKEAAREQERVARAARETLQNQDAQALLVAPARPSDGFKAVDVEVMESLPPQFAVRLVPKVLLELVLDQLVSEDGAFVAKVRYKAPGEGQYSKAVGVRIALGALKVGTHRLEVHLSPAPGEPYAKVQTIELTAR